jgi:predicted nucleic acid-binding protein
MRALLDVNVLIAMLDSDHTSHRAAWDWFREHGHAAWASCPITQNGCVRILAHPGYPNARSVSEIAERLRAATADPAHEFWADTESVLDNKSGDARAWSQAADGQLSARAGGQERRPLGDV